MKPDALPLFPLETVLYPEERLSLYVFEERYKDLVRDCQKWNTPFGIVLMQHGKLEDIGCMADITEAAWNSTDGTTQIMVRGARRFKVLSVKHEHTYLTADIEPLQDEEIDIAPPLKERVIAQHIKLLELAGRTPRPTVYQDRHPLSFFIALNSGLTLEQKQHVLELDHEPERISFLVDHLERFIPAVEESESVRRKVRSNGHFKDFLPEN